MTLSKASGGFRSPHFWYYMECHNAQHPHLPLIFVLHFFMSLINAPFQHPPLTGLVYVPAKLINVCGYKRNNNSQIRPTCASSLLCLAIELQDLMGIYMTFYYNVLLAIFHRKFHYTILRLPSEDLIKSMYYLYWQVVKNVCLFH